MKAQINHSLFPLMFVKALNSEIISTMNSINLRIAIQMSKQSIDQSIHFRLDIIGLIGLN